VGPAPHDHPGRPDYRTLVTRTRLTYAVAVRGQLSPVDGAIELIAVTIDLTGVGDDNSDDDPDD
jgi:hypothetical protein